MDFYDQTLAVAVRGFVAQTRSLPTGPGRADAARALMRRMDCLQERARGGIPDDLSRQMEAIQRQLTAAIYESHPPATPTGRWW